MGFSKGGKGQGPGSFFARVKGHAGHVFNDIADDYATAGADCAVCTQTPFTLSSNWYSPDSVISDWAWLVNLTGEQKHQLGLFARAGILISFPPILLPDSRKLKTLVAPTLCTPPAFSRQIQANLVSLIIGAVVDKPYKQGTTCFGGKGAMLSAKFSEAKVMLVAF